jgi:protein-L-isoaspartate(D-aspartate) O-methyltransferase
MVRRLALLALLLAACGERPEGTAPPESGAPAAREREGPGAEHDLGRAERAAERAAMVRSALVAHGVTDLAVLRAMRRVPRHRFVPEGQRAHAYANRPLAIGWDQTISQPTVVGSMTEHLELTPESKVLEVGTGSGYQAAVLAEITPHVFTIEIKQPLARRAHAALEANGYTTVMTRTGDGYHGWPEEAPFDAIVVTAASPHVPPPLVRQLRAGGRLVIPVGPAFAQQDLVVVTKGEDGRVRTRSLVAVSFVPLTGSLGEEDASAPGEPDD